jgi:hypothetical protein
MLRRAREALILIFLKMAKKLSPQEEQIVKALEEQARLK